ncbi:MAG: hypothetical protein KTR16_12530 [Acidiferrobacterales bacterium]|nr:hypothetical protein [Acidiferrobacterales bacterium]
MNYYNAYELCICSDIEIPELFAWPEGEPSDADLHIYEQRIDESIKNSLVQIGPFLFADENTVLLQVANIAVFLIENGRQIIYQKIGDSHDDDVRAFLLGSCLGAILIQRDFLVLHASTVEVDDGCIVCVGRSTAGKSTLAATFLQSGFSIISDDVCAIGADNCVIPGVPRVKINQDTADFLNIDTSALKVIRAVCDGKFSLPLGDRFCSEKLPIRAIYELAVGKDEMSITRPSGQFECFSVINRNLYRPRYVKALEKSKPIFEQECELASTVPVFKITRPMAQKSSDQIQKIILENLNDLDLKKAR